MITNWFTLQKLSDYFNGQYANTVLDRCFTYEKNELWLQFRDQAPLKVHLGQPFQYALIGTEGMTVKKETVRIFPTLEGAIVKSVSMLPGERIMRFSFQDGSVLFILFLSNRGNVIHKKFGAIEYFKKKIRIDPEILDEKEHRDFQSPAQDPRFSPFWKRNAGDILGTRDYREMIRIMTNSNGQDLNGRFVLTQTEQPYDPDVFYDHYRQFVITYIQEGQFHQDLKAIEQRVSDKLDDLQKKIRETKNNGQIEKRVEMYRYFASVLSACRHLITGHEDRFTVPDMYKAEGFPDTIPLKNDLSVSENIDLYFKKARSAANSIDENAKRHQCFLNDFSVWEDLYKSLREIKDAKALRDWKKERSEILKDAELRTPNSLSGLQRAGDNSTRRPYKEYMRDDWRIWVGRSAKDNDELTFKHTSKTDIWLHVRHSTGSHVIIKMDGKKEAPRPIIEYAAALAARYSDEKHSSLVTVAYTQRKYVTKRKGMPPGKVHFQYEKDVMVKPVEI